MAKLRNIFLLLLLTLSVNAEIAFRGAWIATVANIDWPSPEAVGNTEKQQAEMIWILDSLESLGINAIIFQVRPTSDALYYSELEPVAHWLTGTQGSWGEQTPWDPLEWTIEEAHSRNMEVHVWLNPYRVNLAKNDTSILAPNHLMRRHPEWFWCYNKQWYFDPGLDETREWICTIVQDIVERYDIQAIHMDDYFYPYPVGGKALPDEHTFARLPRGYEDIKEWRRNNVDMAIQDISATIRACRPGVQFGISPFGVWRNADVDSTGSATKAGITNYDDLYANIRLWIQAGWIDYVLPQLYWRSARKWRITKSSHTGGQTRLSAPANSTLPTPAASISAWRLTDSRTLRPKAKPTPGIPATRSAARCTSTAPSPKSPASASTPPVPFSAIRGMCATASKPFIQKARKRTPPKTLPFPGNSTLAAVNPSS